MFHWIKLRAFVYATEDREQVLEAMNNTGIDGEMRSDIAEGAYGDSIEVMELRSTKESAIKSLFRAMKKEDIREILRTLEDRIDDENILHFRLDKQRIFENDMQLSHGGDVIAVEIKIEAYPSSREAAMKIMREYLEDLL